MDDSTNTTAQSQTVATDSVQPAPVMPDPMSAAPMQQMNQQPSMADLAGMTPPPPAPIQSEPTSAMDAQPAAPAMPMDTMPKAPAAGNQPAGQDDYAYAEDILEEILDSLDRIEAKLDAMEKKQG